MENRPDLSLCVVAPGSPSLTGRFLRAVHDTADHVSCEFFVLTRSSNRDYSALKEEFPGVVYGEYDGAASLNRAINDVLRQSSGRYISFWDHTSVVSEGCLGRLVGFLDDVPEAGIAGPKMRDEKGRIQQVARTVPSFFSLLSGNALPGRVVSGWGEYAGGEAAWFAGSGMTISRYLLDDIGPVSRYLLLYWPIDLCLRARRAGWHVHYLHDAQIIASLSAWQKAMTCGKRSPAARLWEALFLKFRM